MSVIPCQKNQALEAQTSAFAEVLKTQAHTLGEHGLSEVDFYQGGLFRSAIERIRGQFSATLREKRDFAARILEYMQDQQFVAEWHATGGANRHDYEVTMPSGRVAVLELKGCLDGNNTNIFERPAHAQEFIIWSLCESPAADPRHNVWSGIHTRLSSEIIKAQKLVDGLVVWDQRCGTVARPCPKTAADQSRLTTVGPFIVPPPCIYLFPATIPTVRHNPNPAPHQLADVTFLAALHACFRGRDNELNHVRFEVRHQGIETERRTSVERGGAVVRQSAFTPIRRT